MSVHVDSQPDASLDSSVNAVTGAVVQLFAPVASFKDPQWPGVQRGLPVPPLSTLRGMLAAASGTVDGVAAYEHQRIGMIVDVRGSGCDLETWHPVKTGAAFDRGRVIPGTGGVGSSKPVTRDFLTDVTVTMFLPDEDAAGIDWIEMFYRPMWGLSLGRSQDLVHLQRADRFTATPIPDGDSAPVGRAVAPEGAHGLVDAITVRAPRFISRDRQRTDYVNMIWRPRFDTVPFETPVTSAYTITGGPSDLTGDTIWFL